LNVKGIAEEYVRRCGVDYTILRSAIVYGPNDKFTSGLARILQAFPFLFFTPGDGKVLLQPIWVEDLVTCLAWALEDPETCNRTYEIGGPEYLSFNQIAGLVMNEIGIRRRLTPLRPTTLRGLTVLLESIFPGLPISVFWLDYLAVNRTCALDTAPRVFNLMPARMSQRLAYLRGQNWGASLLRSLMQRQA
jgi:NADH dehydrogenase